jgi:sugar phosphate isomerase/epimerase
MNAPEARPQGAPHPQDIKRPQDTRRPVVLAHGSLRKAGFRDRVAAVAHAGFDGLGLNVREYARLRSDGWSDADIRVMLTDTGLRLVEIETLLGWDDPLEQRDPDGLRREQLAFALADAVGARHVVAVGALTGDLRPTATEGFAALCERAAEHGLLVALEPQGCSSITDLDTATAIVADAGQPNGGLNLDVWHQTRCDWPLPSLRRLAPEQIVVIQVDDGPEHPVTDDYLDECTRYRSAPGQGDFDVDGFLRALLATGTTAPVSVEVLSDANDQLPPATVAGELAIATQRVLRAASVPA